MLIILEGPDGSGKTTLARRIQETCGASYLHCTCRYLDRMFTYHTAILLHALLLINKTGKPCIIDRWWPSEYIYGATYRGGTKFPHYGRLFDRILLTFGGVYVWCLPSDLKRYVEKFKELVDSGREKFTDVTKMTEVYQRYHDTWYGYHTHKGGSYLNKKYDGYLDAWFENGGARNQCHVVKYDMYTDCADSLIENFIKPRFHKLEDINLPIIGNVDAKVILVGDRPNLKWGPRRPTWPFFEHANCSLYLASFLDDLMIPEDRLCYVNINQAGGLAALNEWMCTVGGRTVILFGNDVEETFTRNFPSRLYYPVPHPQAARRFPKYRKIFEKKMRGILCSSTAATSHC
jgi:hypothetical protein